MKKPLLGKHRIEALTDGVYAVAITLLVLELRLPETGRALTDQDLQTQLIAILPRLFSWLVSFVFLALFWISVHRLFHRLRGVDARVMVLAFWHIALVCIAPFVVATYGAHIMLVTAQVLYNTMLAAFALNLVCLTEYACMHPELVQEPMSHGHRIALRIQFGGLILCALLSSLIGRLDAQLVGAPFFLMFFASALGKRVERKLDAPLEAPPLQSQEA